MFVSKRGDALQRRMFRVPLTAWERVVTRKDFSSALRCARWRICFRFWAARGERWIFPRSSAIFFATGTCSSSHDHTFGAALICGIHDRGMRGTKGHLFAEGMVSAPFIAKRLGRRVRRFPLFLIALALIDHPKEGTRKLKSFLF